MGDPVIDAARKALGPVGVTLPVSFTEPLDMPRQRAAVVRLERLGYRAVWTNEVVGGKDALVQLAVLLAATESMTFGTSIANIWTRAPETMHGAASVLAQAFPDRFVLGLGVGYKEQAAVAGREFGSPLATIRDFVARMDNQTQPPAPTVPYPRIIAANGPKMLAQAGEIADGALPAGVAPGFTAKARETLGPDKLLVVGLQVLRDDLMDAASIAAAIQAHLAAGADHVDLLPPVGVEFGAAIDRFAEFASVLVR